MFMDIWEKNEELRTEDLPGYLLGIRRVLRADGVEEGKSCHTQIEPVTNYQMLDWSLVDQTLRNHHRT